MAKGDVLVRMKADVSNYDANIAKARRQLENFKKDNLSLGGVLKQTQGALLATAARFASVTAAVGALGSAFMDNIATARKFEVSMSQLSSLTGMVGEDLAKLKDYAIELGSSTTLSASQVADAFKMIGSQQPQLLASGEALKQVTKYAITLSEAAGIELSTAAQTLSTSINQMGGDSDNAARYINVLAAASQKGAGDIAWLGEALTKSATAAKAVGTDYEELVANLEQLAKAGFDASTSGTALRSIIMNLEKQANNDFKPSIVGLTQAFQNLADAHLTISGYQDIVGKMFATQAMALANAAGEAKNMTVAITGTNTAEEQAKTNTDNLEGSLKSLSSAWEGLNLHLNSSNGYLRTVVDWLKDVVVWADKAVVGLGEVTGNRNQLNNESGGGNTRVDRQINTLSNTNINRRQAIYSQQVEKYWRFINDWEKKLKEAENRTDVFAWETIKKNNDIADAKANIAGAQSMLKEYQSKAQKLLKMSSPSPGKGGNNNGIVVDVDVDTEEGTKNIKELQNEIKKLKKLRDDAASAGDTKLRDQYNAQIKSVQAEIKSMRGTSNSHKVKTETVYAEGSIAAQEKLVSDLQKKWNEAGEDMRTGYLYQLIEAENKLKSMKDEQKALRDMTTWGDLKGAPVTGLGESSFSGKSLKELQGVKLELKLPKEKTEASLTKEVGNMAGGISQMVGGIEALGIELPEGLKSAVEGISSLITIVSGIATIVTAIEALTAADTIIPFARGGIVPHAANGYFVPGNNYSGDTTPIMANAGELVLNKAQQSTLASELQNGGNRIQVIGRLSGEQLFLCAENWAKRTGKGEFVTW